MEPALKTFLDEVEDETVGGQRLRGLLDEEATHTVDNDNDSKDLSTSGVIDLRDMARRYKEGLAMGEMGKVDAPAWDDGASLAHILPPAPEPTKKSRSGIGIIVAASLAMAALLIGGTALVTAKLVRASVIAEMSQKATPAPAAVDTEQAPVAVAAVSVDTEADEPAELEPIEFEVESTPESNTAALVASAPISHTIQAEPDLVESTRSKPEAAVVVAEAKLESKREARRESRRVRVAEAKPEAEAASEPVVEAEPAASPEAAPEPVAVAEPAAVEKEKCDEVLCLVEGRGCCGKNPTAVAAAAPEKEEVDLSLPARLTRSDISQGLARYNGRLSSCGLKNGVTGAAPVKFKINADGSLKSASTSAGNTAFQSCISDVLKKARFSEARGETTLSYPIIIR